MGTAGILAAGVDSCPEAAGSGSRVSVDIETEESFAGREETRRVTGSVDMVMALSGFSKCSESGPSPRRIRARESGIDLLCQPWSD